MTITPAPAGKNVNPLIQGDWGGKVTTTSVRDTASTDSARDKRAIRDFKGNIIAYADAEETSVDFDWNPPAPVVPAVGTPTGTTHSPPPAASDPNIVAGTAAHPLAMAPEAGTVHHIPSNPDGSAYIDISNMFIPPLTEYNLDNVLPFSLVHLIHLDVHTGLITVDAAPHGEITFGVIGATGEATHNFTVTIPATVDSGGGHVIGTVL